MSSKGKYAVGLLGKIFIFQITIIMVVVERGTVTESENYWPYPHFLHLSSVMIPDAAAAVLAP